MDTMSSAILHALEESTGLNEAKAKSYTRQPLKPDTTRILETANKDPQVAKLRKQITTWGGKDPGYGLARMKAMNLVQDINFRLGSLLDAGAFSEAKARQALKAKMFQSNVTWLIDNPSWLPDYISALLKEISRLSKQRQESNTRLSGLLSGLRGDRGSFRLMSEAASGPVDDHAAKELKLYIDNDYQIYRWKESIDLTLAKWLARGQYQRDRAKEAYDRLVMEAARAYLKKHSSGKVQDTFNKLTRDKVATDLRDDFEDELKSDPMAYDSKLPKKWQGKPLKVR